MLNDNNDSSTSLGTFPRALLLKSAHHRLLQFSSGGAAGGFFIGDEEDPNTVDNNNTNGNNTTDDTTDDDNDSKDAGETILNIFLVLLAGIAVVLGIALITYVAAVVADKYGFCCPGYNVTVADLQDLDQGVTARRAGLWGLRLQERVEILQYVFRDKKVVYHRAVKKERVVVPMMGVVKGQVSETVGDANVETEKDVENGVVETESKIVSKATSETNENEDAESGVDQDEDDDEEEKEYLDDADHERVCCICLAEYEDGCALLSGKNCEHKMHYDCSMEWLIKHDRCPYCRKVAVSATEFRQAAIEVLGKKRVKDLGHGGGGERMERATAPVTASVVQEGGVAAVVTTEASGAVEPDLEAGGSAAEASEIEMTPTDSSDGPALEDAEESVGDEMAVEEPVQEAKMIEGALKSD